MRRLVGLKVLAAITMLGFFSGKAQAQKLMESLDRGVVAINEGNGKVFVGWRLLGTEPLDLSFNVYRASGNAAPVKVNASPLTGPTHLQDTNVSLDVATVYTVRAIVNGREQDAGRGFTLAANAPVQNYIEFPIRLPEATNAGDASAADLDGDGDYEIIVKGIQRSRDTASAGITGNTVLQAYQTDGTLMWTVQMGINIREGEHDTQFMVYDFDCDGKAELACRTSDGSVDGTGKVIGEPGKDWRDLSPGARTLGKNMTGPEYVTIFDGLTGKELASVPYVPNQLPLDGWGGIGGNSGNDSTGNRNMRFLAGVVDDDGNGLYSTGLRHGDALHVSDLDPSHPGQEVFGPHENEGGAWDQWTPAASLFDAKTGELLWGIGYGGDAGRGLAGDIDPRHPGAEMWGIPGGLYNIKGDPISTNGPRMTNFVIWWDGDKLREMLDGNRIAKWNWKTGQLENLMVAQDAQAAAGTKSSPVLSADLFGDWREECIFRVGNSALRIYTTTIPTDRRIHTLMHDPQYRMAIAWQNVSYNQPPHTSFFIGHDMQAPPQPNIKLIRNP